MSVSYGNHLKLTIDGGSHDPEIRMQLEGFPAGMTLDTDKLQRLMERRAPGRNAYATARKEADIPVFTSGLSDGKTDGTPITAVIRNQNQRSGDYPDLADRPRPSHADYAAVQKYGPSVDLRGGGHFSGRLTSLLCVAGGLCLQFLAQHSVRVAAHIQSIGNRQDERFDPVTVGEVEFDALAGADFPVLNAEAGIAMQQRIAEVKADGDSVGGVIEGAVIGLPAGLGEHLFAGIEGHMSSLLFSIPAVKGVEFGSGFASAGLTGSQNNDPFCTDGQRIFTRTNNSGGILGGMTSGMPVVFRVAVKPTPTIAKEQDTVSLSRMENVKLTVHGRHDPCIVPRAVPVVEAAAAIALCDLWLAEGRP